MNFIKTKLFPFALGLIVSSIIMSLFEYTNSKIFPFPEGMNKTDLLSLRAFTDTLPPQAYLLVILGWMLGSAAGGYIASRFSNEKRYSVSLALGIFLTLMGIVNNIGIGAPTIMTIIGLVVFITFTYLGCKQARK